MPYLPTSQAFLEQSALLLEAYPETRITTKYSFPTERPAQQLKRQKSQAKKEQKTEPEQPTAPVASLVLKTYNPVTGICLKYQTNKLQEVGRLMTGLGKLAGGADVASLGLSGPATGDVEMGDAEDTAGVAPAQSATANANAAAGGKTGGKGKKKGGKGKR